MNSDTIRQAIVCTFLISLSLCYTRDLTAERWYEIEVILFEQATGERLASESWDSNSQLPDVTKSRDILSRPTHMQSIEQLCFDDTNYQVIEQPVTVIPAQEIMVGPDDFTDNPLLDLPTQTSEQSTSEEPDEVIQPYQLLDDSEHELTDVYQQLRRRRGYRMLFHEAWRQPAGSKQETLPIRIYAGKDYGDTFNYQGDAIIDLELNASAFDNQSMERFDQNQIIDAMMDMDQYFRLTKADIARDRLTSCAEKDRLAQAEKRQPVWQIDGNLHVYTERFRHVDTNLVIRFPDTEEVDLRAIETNLAADELLANIDISSEQSSFDWQFADDFLAEDSDASTVIREVLKYYPMQQSRRIIDSKTHYFDHPLMGMIIQLRSFDPDEETSS